MAIQGPIPVDFSVAFPHGVYAAGAFEPVRDFDASKGGLFVQAKDKASGLPLWLIEVIDADPQARDKTAPVKIAAPVQPVLPPPLAGSPFTPVEFTGLTVAPYVNQARAAGVLAARIGRGGPRQNRSGAATGDSGMSDGGSFASLGVHVGADWMVRCDTHPDTTPILSVKAGPSWVSLSIAARTVIPAEAVAFARELARQAARFAADCERLHAGQQDRDRNEGQAADSPA